MQLAGKITLLVLIPKCAANIVAKRNAQQVTVACTAQREHAASKCDPFPSAQIYISRILHCIYYIYISNSDSNTTALQIAALIRRKPVAAQNSARVRVELVMMTTDPLTATHVRRRSRR